MTPTDQPSETESVPIGSKSVDQPICGKCGNPMSPEDSTMHPELFMHDACLPTELLLREVQAGAPVCPCCHKADRVVKSDHPEHGEFFCPCNEPGPQYFDYDGSGTLLTTNKDGKPIAVHVDFEGGMHFRYGGPAETPVAGVEQHCRCAECGAEWDGPVGQQDGLTRCNCGSTAIEETLVREPGNAILIESEPAERSLDEKIHPEYWRGREHQLTEDENAIEAQREVIATLTSRVAELEKERDEWQKRGVEALQARDSMKFAPSSPIPLDEVWAVTTDQGCPLPQYIAGSFHPRWREIRESFAQLTADLSAARAEAEKLRVALNEAKHDSDDYIGKVRGALGILSGQSLIHSCADLRAELEESRRIHLQSNKALRAELQSAKEALVKTERGLMDVLPIGEHTLESIPSVIKQLVDACAELRRDSETWRHVLEMVRANGFESVGQVLVKLDSLQKERAIILRLDQPWPLVSILQELIHAAAILLEEKDYDGHGWEGIDAARGLADSLRQELEKMRGEG